MLFFFSPMPSDLEYMQLALEQARISAEAGEVPIGALLVHEDKIVARSGNRTIRDNDPTAHAEIVVLRETAKVMNNYRLANTILYVTLEPCAMCAGAVIQARVSKLVYGADDPKGGAVRSCFEVLSNPKLNHRVDVVRGLLADESASLLQSFFTARR
jgi:tRNA(adenine34) deaminase